MPCCCTPRAVVPEGKKGRVHFMIGRGGGGHIAAARALQDCLKARGVPWAKDIEFIDTGYLFDQIIAGRAEPRQGFDADELYNWLMKRGHYWLASLLSPLGNLVVKAMYGTLLRGLEQFWREREPRAVVSFVPISGALMRSALLRACPNAPMLTVVTDMSSTSHHKWLEPYDAESGVNHTIVAGSDVLQQQAQSLGYPSSNVLATSGMLVHPRFYEESESKSKDAGSSASQTRGVIFFGGQAPMRVETIARRALDVFPDLHLVVMCGGNKKLLERMRQLEGERCTVEGFLQPAQIRDHMRAASFIIGKPGPGVVAEAIVCGLPYVSELTKPMAQEQCVLEYLEASGIGVLVASLETLPRDLLSRCDAARAVAAAQRNRSVFEVADFLQGKLQAAEDAAADASEKAPLLGASDKAPKLGASDKAPTLGAEKAPALHDILQLEDC